jgi:xylan 1,4-beta-xylosidase
MLAMSVGVCPEARAEAGDGVTIDVDATAAGAPLEPVWAFYGYDEANYTTTPEGEELLRALAAAHATQVRIRTHFLFDTGDGTAALKWGSTNIYSEDVGGNAVYDYALIDSIMDATVGAGTLPLVELGFMPVALSSRPDPYQNSNTYALDGGSFYPPRDFDRWASLVTAWATHVKERYPGAESSWQWELWNEPDIGYWHGTFDDYARLYDYTEAALHAVFPDASLGGPAVASPEGGFLTQFLEHCATGTNAVTGQIGTRLDMVSFHAKGGVSLTNGNVQMDLGNQLRLHRAGFEAVSSSARFARTPIVISEADPDGCAACPVNTAPQNAYRNSPAYGAYEMAMMKRSLELAAELGVNLRGVLTWAFTFPGSPYFAGYRALATNGIHLPVLNAFKLLGSLHGARLPVTSSGARPLVDILANGVRREPDVDALAAIDGDRIRILVWHYHDDLVLAAPVPVTLEVSVPPALAANLGVTHTRVDDTHGDAYGVWVQQGRPAMPSEMQQAMLRAAMEPVVLSSGQAAIVADGNVRLSFDLPRFGVSLIELAPLHDGEPDASRNDAGNNAASCSFRLPARARIPLPALPAVSLAIALARRRRLAQSIERRRAARAARDVARPMHSAAARTPMQLEISQ